jgi:uncharacterized protein DUF2188
MAPRNTRTVAPMTGGWTIVGGNTRVKYRTQEQAEAAARSDLLATGGGELAVKGRDGSVQSQDTIGRPDPPESKG